MVQVYQESDPLVWDNTEPVTFYMGYRQEEVEAPGVLRRAPGYVERAPTRGVYVAALLNWLVPDGVLGGRLLQPADLLVDGLGVTYTVLEADRQATGTVWRVRTIDLYLAYGLDDTATVLRPTNSQDAAGGRVPTFAAVYTGIAARFQPVLAERDDERGRRLTMTTHNVYLGQQLAITEEDVLQDQNGNQYQIRAVHNQQRIDELPYAECEFVVS